MGIAQSCAFLPGISRLAITCCAGYLYGYSLADAFFLSWLMQAPLMAAAIAKAVWHLSKDSQLQQVLNPAVVLVILGSSGISWMLLCAVKYSIFVHLWYLFAGYMLLPITILIWLTK
jgi:undecaprenyl pyrophosphate phosphatase UppP